jgi:transposase
MALAGIIFVLRTGIPWQMLPKGIGFPSGVTCWRRLVEWQEIGCWDAMWQAALSTLNKADRIAMERVAVDGSTVPAKKGAKAPVRIPPIAGKTARNTTSWSINEEYRSQLRSRRRTLMIPR